MCFIVLLAVANVKPQSCLVRLVSYSMSLELSGAPVPPPRLALEYRHFQIPFGENAMLHVRVLKPLPAILAVSVWMNSG
jgi:hypothetical protein